ncbi:MAG: hypothetical protein HPY69_13500 [Armatimonadetes bacterium]|nr:hypothetical protein [Armatimonadota bacterium]
MGPQVVLDFTVSFSGPINDAFYYFIPIDTDGDFGLDGPIPVAAGPYWQNGWGTGSFSHFIAYHLGQYNVYRVQFQTTLRTPGAGVSEAGDVVSGGSAGAITLTVQSVEFGAVEVSGSGMITAAANTSFQAAGELTLATDATGQIVAGSVSFTPASQGGRALTSSEQAVLTALNAGGVQLTADTLVDLGLTLTVAPPVAGSQTLTVEPTVGQVRSVFVDSTSGRTTTTTAALQANSAATIGGAPGPVVTVVTGDLVSGGVAVIDISLSPIATLLGPPFDFVRPVGTNQLQATIDLATLGSNIPDLSINMIATNELIFDPNITDPNLHSYDGLGTTGNRYVTFRTTQFQTITNGSGLFDEEKSGDATLTGPTTQAEREALDIVDWSITIRRLR